jgi:SAM-dependent methyltransferase
MQWFEDETFWETFYPHLFTEDRMAGAPGEVDRLLALAGVTSGAALDLCCGPGRHSLALAQKGFAVTAVDRSRFLLDKARERAAGAPVEFVEADMREFVRQGAFDLAINLFTSFGYFETPDEDLQVLRNVRASIKPGGVFVIDVLGKECLASLPSRTRWVEAPGKDLFVQHCGILPGWSRSRMQWLLVQGERAVRYDYEYNVYSGQELYALLRSAGFDEVRLFGNLDGAAYDSAATRLVARAQVKAAG